MEAGNSETNLSQHVRAGHSTGQEDSRLPTDWPRGAGMKTVAVDSCLPGKEGAAAESCNVLVPAVKF